MVVASHQPNGPEPAAASPKTVAASCHRLPKQRMGQISGRRIYADRRFGNALWRAAVVVQSLNVREDRGERVEGQVDGEKDEPCAKNDRDRRRLFLEA